MVYIHRFQLFITSVTLLQLTLFTMKQNMILMLLLCCVGLAAARYVAIPVEDIVDVGELSGLRMPRETELARGAREVPTSRQSHESQRPGAYVDFGAYTGARGSYGWYADFPVHRDV